MTPSSPTIPSTTSSAQNSASAASGGSGPSGSSDLHAAVVPTGIKQIQVDVFPAGMAPIDANILARLQTLRSESSNEPPVPPLEYPPVDPYVAQLSAERIDDRTLELVIFNPGPDDYEIDAFQMTGNPAGDSLRDMRKDGALIWRNMGTVTTPTGIEGLNIGGSNRHTLDALDEEILRIRFWQDPVGLTSYVLRFFGANGVSATLEFEITW